MSYQHKIIIITGAAQGIGKAAAEAFAAEGAVVIIADYHEEAGMVCENELKEKGYTVEYVKTDVKKPSHIESLFKHTSEKYGTIDILINNAGIASFTSPFKLSLEDWENVMQTNLRSVFLCSKQAALIMKEIGGGTIINIASTRASMSEPDSEAYAAAKSGILGLTHAMAASFAPYEITVNAISPGWIETGNYNNLRRKDHSQHWANRVGRPEDIAKACLFLGDSANNFINGENLVIDGGMTRKMIYEH
ncbi:SDR family oxidoreductase [Alteribacillus sp. HJP-4]|uniref:SDR family oxidoreductase n=1 Tax=Alteribacillus sp. HJP-4 TaxID=2775394 RepID=UPI0035CD1D52